jgi:hypothetical protein
VPVVIRYLENGSAWAVSGAVHQDIDAPPAGKGEIDQSAEVVDGLVRAGQAHAIELAGQLFAFAGGRQDRDLETVQRQASRCRRSHAAAARDDHRHLVRCHVNLQYASDTLA